MRPHRSPFESVRPQVNSGRDQSIRTLSFLGVSVRPFLQNPATSGAASEGFPSKPCHIWDRRHKTAFKTLSHLGLPLHAPLQNPVTSGAMCCSSPSKPCHIWVAMIAVTFKTLSHLGQGLAGCLQNPVTSGSDMRGQAFKTLSHLGIFSAVNLQNPVTSGLVSASHPSKPCHIWEARHRRPFKTLSHLGMPWAEMPSKPCHIWARRGDYAFKTLSHLGIQEPSALQNPVTSGNPLHPSLQNPVTSGCCSWSRPSKPCHIWAKTERGTFKTLSHLGDYHKSFVVHRKFGVKRM